MEWEERNFRVQTRTSSKYVMTLPFKSKIVATTVPNWRNNHVTFPKRRESEDQSHDNHRPCVVLPHPKQGTSEIPLYNSQHLKERRW